MICRTSSWICLACLLVLLAVAAANPAVVHAALPAQPAAGCDLVEAFHGLDHAVLHWDATACSGAYDQARLVVTRGAETFATSWTPAGAAVGDVTYSWAGAAVGEQATAKVQARQGANAPFDAGPYAQLTVDGAISGTVRAAETVSASQLPAGLEYIAVRTVTVLAGGSLALGPGNYAGELFVGGSIHVYGTISIDPAANLQYYWGYPAAVYLYAPHQFGSVDHAHFYLKAGSAGSSFTGARNVLVDADPGGGTTTLTQVMTATVYLRSGGLEANGGRTNILAIGGSGKADITGDAGSIVHSLGDFRGDLTVSSFKGDIAFDGSGFGGRGLVGGTATLEGVTASGYINVVATDGGHVTLKDSDTQSVGLILQGAPAGNAEITNNRIRGSLTLNGGNPQVTGNHIGGDIYLVGETGGSISDNRVLGGVLISNTGGAKWGSGGLKPTISGNSLLGSTAISADFVLTTTIPIGENFYGDAEGPRISYTDGTGPAATFLGRRGGKAVIGANASSPPWFLLATPMTSGQSWSDTEMCPRFWVQGIRIGQHILQDSSQGTYLTLGKEILATLDIVSSYPIAGGRVYAELDGVRVAESPVRLYRDLHAAKRDSVRGGYTTANLILPPRYQAPVNPVRLDVWLDTSGLPCSVGRPLADVQHLYGGNLTWEAPMDRPLRVGIVPVKLFGFINAVGDPGPIRTALKETFPDMFPVRRTDIEVDVLPTISQYAGPLDWGSASVLALGLSARMAAGGAVEQAAAALMGAPTYDFVVAALPENAFGAGIDGATLAINPRYPMVDASRADAVVHELGHGMGLWRRPEQYNQHPPDGLPVVDLTAFATTGKTTLPGDKGRITHFPGVSSWLYLRNGFVDVMGSSKSMWPIPDTYAFFKNWLRGLPPTITNASPAPLARSAAPDADPVTSNVLFFGSTKADPDHPGYFKLVPETIGVMDMSGAVAPAAPPFYDTPCTWYYPIYYDAAGQMLTYNIFCVQGSYAEPHEQDVFVKWIFFPSRSAARARLVIREGNYYGPAIYDSWRANSVSGALLSPTAGATLGASVMLQWQPASKPLWRAVSYSTDGGATWRLMSAPQQADSLTLPTDFLPAGQHISLRTWSADEFSFAERRVDNLAAPNRPPVATIVWPPDGALAVPGTAWDLRGRASDIDDGELDGGQWTSSRDGALGAGTNLSGVVLTPGQHTLTYTISDAAGLSASAATHVTVGALAQVDLAVAADALTVEPPGVPDSASWPIHLTPGQPHALRAQFINPGVALTVTVAVTVTPPGGPPAGLLRETLPLQPFEIVAPSVEYTPPAEGTYSFEMSVNSSTLPDPVPANNRRTWQYSTVPAALEVPAVPDISVARAGVELTLPIGGQAGESLMIYNPGTATLSWSVAESPAVPWLSEGLTQGYLGAGKGGPILLSVDAAALGAGAAERVYTTTLRISHNTGRPNPIDVPVTLSVGGSCAVVAGPTIAMTPSAPAGGDNVHFQGHVAAGSSPISYTWDFGDGSAAGTGEQAFHAYPALGHPQAYTVKVTAANACSTGVSATRVVVVDGKALYLPVVVKR